MGRKRTRVRETHLSEDEKARSTEKRKGCKGTLDRRVICCCNKEGSQG